MSRLSPVIGRGGEQITRIQLESGCKIQIAAGETDYLHSSQGLPEVIPSMFCCSNAAHLDVDVNSFVCVCVCRQWRSDGAAMFPDWYSREHRVSF